MAHTGKLSAVEVTRAKKGPAVLHDGGGLYLRVSATGAKSWVFRFQLDGKRRDMGLGPFPDISLAEARLKASVHRKQRHEGIDPLVAKAAQRQAERVSVAKGRTFRECAVDFIEKNRAGWRNAKHRQQWENTLATYVYPTLGELPVSAIDAGLVVQVLDPMWAIKPETASRVRGRIEVVLDAATVRGFRQGPNPAQWKGNLAHILPARSKVRKVEHHAALPFDKMPEFLLALRAGAITCEAVLNLKIAPNGPTQILEAPPEGLQVGSPNLIVLGEAHKHADAAPESIDLNLGKPTVSETLAEIAATEWLYPYCDRVEHKKTSLAGAHMAQIAVDYEIPRARAEHYLSNPMMGVCGKFLWTVR
jgi:Arm DNA-binding domain